MSLSASRPSWRKVSSSSFAAARVGKKDDIRDRKSEEAVAILDTDAKWGREARGRPFVIGV